MVEMYNLVCHYTISAQKNSIVFGYISLNITDNHNQTEKVLTFQRWLLLGKRLMRENTFLMRAYVKQRWFARSTRKTLLMIFILITSLVIATVLQ